MWSRRISWHRIVDVMNQVVVQLFEEVQSKRGRAHDALSQLAMLLERWSGKLEEERFYRLSMRPEVYEFEPSEDELKEIINELGGMILSDKMTPHMVFALGRTLMPEAVAPIVTLLVTRTEVLDEEATFQTLCALQNLLVVGEEMGEATTIIEPVARQIPPDLVNALRTIVDRGSERVREVGTSLFDEITNAMP